MKRIPLREGFSVWTDSVGDGPAHVLSLHGGPAATHELWKSVERHVPDGVTFHYYDQLGSFHSDQPDDTSLWTIERFVEEVEQVRTALGLDASSFYLLGSSWGGMLAMEYALAHQDALKGLLISNMTADFHRYAAYNARLRSRLAPDVLERLEAFESRGEYHDPAYQELMIAAYYRKHLIRLDEWPEEIDATFEHLNQQVYEYMQGPSEFVPGGILKDWSVWDRLGEIAVPTLTIGAAWDTMNPAEMEEMAGLVKRGRYLHCPNGSHLAMWDDEEVYWNGVFRFIDDVESGRF